MGKRIEEVLTEIGQKQIWLAERSGVDPGTLSAIIKRDSVRSQFSHQLADALEVNERWLSSGQGPKFKTAKHAAQMQTFNYDNLLAKTLRQAVPIISLIKAGDFADSHTPYEPGEGDVFESPDFKLGPRGWAHEVDGWSMYDGSEDGIKPGYIIFCDPDVLYFPNALVIAKDVDKQKATFKQLVSDEDGWLLRPLNKDPVYKAFRIDDPALRVIAVVTEVRPRSRRLI